MLTDSSSDPACPSSVSAACFCSGDRSFTRYNIFRLFHSIIASHTKDYAVRLLPHHLYTVPHEKRVFTHKSQTLSNGLRDQDPVKGILVQVWQPSQRTDM